MRRHPIKMASWMVRKYSTNTHQMNVGSYIKYRNNLKHGNPNAPLYEVKKVHLGGDMEDQNRLNQFGANHFRIFITTLLKG